jgi:hypothetical protein
MRTSAGSGNFKAVKLPEPQTVVGRAYSVIDIGTVPNIYQGKLNGVHHRVYVTWELPTLLAVFNDEKGEEPFVVGEEFTLSHKSNSNFAKLIAQWRGKPFTPEEQANGFDPTKMLGKTALVQLVHKTKKAFEGQQITEITNENTNLKMQGIMKRPTEMAIPKQINPDLVWDWDLVAANGFNKEAWKKIPKFIRGKMVDSEEFKQYAPADVKSEAGSSNSQAGTQQTTTQQTQQVQEPQSEGTVTEEEW